MLDDARPRCESEGCNNLAHNQGRRKDGTIMYRRRVCEVTGEKKYVCGGCHARYYQKKTGAGWTFGSRNGESREYMKFRKDYCENRDGRLGFTCTSRIINEKMLCVDHVLENFSTDDPDKNEPHNLQTLCHNCHAYKNHLVATRDRNILGEMLRNHYRVIKTRFTNKRMNEDIHKMLVNAGKKAALILIFSCTFLGGCSKMDNIKENISTEVRVHNEGPSTEHYEDGVVKYRVVEF